MKVFTRKGLALAAALSAALTLAACGGPSRDIAPDGSGAKELVWPDPADTNATHKGGAFPNVIHLGQVQSGLTRGQVAALIGEPHFSEGVGAREWDYLFDFRDAGAKTTQCRYKVLFDKDGHARNSYWNPASCADFLKPLAAPAAAATRVKRVKQSVDALFLFDRLDLAAIQSEGRARLDAIAQELTAAGNQTDSARVTGHADRLGSVSYNRQLAALRAETVRRYLISRGVAASRITAQGRGANDPLVDCVDRSREALIACLAPNRRVTVDVMRSE